VEELTTTSKLLSPTYFKIKGNCSMKALKFKRLKENTGLLRSVILRDCSPELCVLLPRLCDVFLFILACSSSYIADVGAPWVWEDSHHPRFSAGYGILNSGVGESQHRGSLRSMGPRWADVGVYMHCVYMHMYTCNL
jgi:hypothetical protein